MKTKRAVVVGVLLCLIGVAGIKPASAVTLASLVSSGGTLSVGPLIFSNFNIVGIPTPGVSFVQPANVDISTITLPNGEWGINIAPVTSPIVINGTANQMFTADLTFDYKVAIAPGFSYLTLTSAHSQIAGTGNVTSGSITSFNDTVSEILSGNGGYSKSLTVFASSNAPPVLSDYTLVPKLPFLNVEKDIGTDIGFGPNGGTLSLTGNAMQTYDVPEPGTFAMLLGMGFSGGLFGLKLRRRRV